MEINEIQFIDKTIENGPRIFMFRNFDTLLSDCHWNIDKENVKLLIFI